MYRLKSTLFSFAVIIALLLIISESEAETTVRRFRMGFTGFPSDITLEAVLEAREFSRQNADILAHHIEGIPWAESLHGRMFSEEMMNDWKGKLQATPKDGKVYLAISPGRGELKVSDKALPLPDELKDKSYDHPLVKKAFLNYTRRAIEFFEPDYLGIGIEVNEIYQKSPQTWKNYVSLHRYIYDAIKKEKPYLPIFASFTLHNLLTANKNDQTRTIAAFDEIMDKCDLVAVSFYPFIAGGTTDIEKAFQLLSDHYDRYEKPYAIVETGEAADKLKFPTTGQIIYGTPQKQENYYRVLLDAAQKKDFEFVISFLHKDYDAMWEKIKAFSPEAFMAWRDCGLLDEDGKQRPAYKIWKQYFDMPLENTIYGFRLDDIDGNQIELSTYKGKVLQLSNSQAVSNGIFPNKYFKIQVVDRQTDRGVPLVELRTTNNVRYYTDSNGIVAYYEPGLMNQEVFFFVESHGYEFPKDGFGMNGTGLKTSPGGSSVIKIDRLNIAERLYRVTGQGIYRDSVLTNTPVPLENPVLDGQVMGQDSVYTCIYRDRLFWLWGDTNRPSYPLGHFATAGAVSDLPGKGGLDSAVGVNLEYFVDETGFSRPICLLKEEGLVWLDGLLVIRDTNGQQRMVAKFARMKDLGQAYERGLVVFNDQTESFEPVVRSGPDFLPYPDSGHAFAVDVEGEQYYYFATQFPLSVRMRVKAEWEYVIDPNYYEVLTSQKPSEPCQWIRTGELINNNASQMSSLIKALKEDKEDTYLYDVTSGKKVTPHGGSVYFNNYRRRWISIFVQQFGNSSLFGEVWYAEADTPVGPWAYARKIVTHNKYTFYNPMQHPYFDKDGGRVIFFEGTYSNTFSGSEKNPTPRYDYNQIMYCLNLEDPRLALPVAVYQMQDQNDYLLRDGVEKSNKWDSVESIPFYAIESNRAYGNLIAIYADKGKQISLTRERPNSSAQPLFYALPAKEKDIENTCIVPLYEYRNIETKQSIYSTKPALEEKGWARTEDALCRVFKAPLAPPLLDSKAKPIIAH